MGLRIISLKIHLSIEDILVDVFLSGSTVALHCCKAHAEIDRKMGNSTPCKIITPKSFILKLCRRDYVVVITHLLLSHVCHC